MRVHEMKEELGKVSHVVPELRQELDDAYKSEGGKRSKIKLFWRQYEGKHKELSSSREFRHLNFLSH